MINILDYRHVFTKFTIYLPYRRISGTGRNVFETMDYSAVCIHKSAHISRQKMWAKWSKSYWNRQQHKWLVPCDDIYWLSTFANKSCTVLGKHRKLLIFNQSHVHGDTVCAFILNHMMRIPQSRMIPPLFHHLCHHRQHSQHVHVQYLVASVTYRSTFAMN